MFFACFDFVWLGFCFNLILLFLCFIFAFQLFVVFLVLWLWMWLLCLLFFFDIASLVLCTDALDVILLLSFFVSLTFLCFPYLCFLPFSSILLDFSLQFVSCRYVFSFLRLVLFILLFVLSFLPLLCSGLLFCNAFLPLLCIACQLFCFAFVLISTLLVLFYSLCLICHGLFFSSY